MMYTLLQTEISPSIATIVVLVSQLVVINYTLRGLGV